MSNVTAAIADKPAVERATANEDVNAWLASLPADDWTDALDDRALRPVRWVDGVGFVEAER